MENKTINRLEWKKAYLKMQFNSTYGGSHRDNFIVYKHYRSANMRIKRIRTINKIYE